MAALFCRICNSCLRLRETAFAKLIIGFGKIIEDSKKAAEVDSI